MLYTYFNSGSRGSSEYVQVVVNHNELKNLISIKVNHLKKPQHLSLHNQKLKTTNTSCTIIN